jgi:hypothetical protein
MWKDENLELRVTRSLRGWYFRNHRPCVLRIHWIHTKRSRISLLSCFWQQLDIGPNHCLVRKSIFDWSFRSVETLSRVIWSLPIHLSLHWHPRETQTRLCWWTKDWANNCIDIISVNSRKSWKAKFRFFKTNKNLNRIFPNGDEFDVFFRNSYSSSAKTT